jgi:hypothetical protein
MLRGDDVPLTAEVDTDFSHAAAVVSGTYPPPPPPPPM